MCARDEGPTRHPHGGRPSGAHIIRAPTRRACQPNPQSAVRLWVTLNHHYRTPTRNYPIIILLLLGANYSRENH